MAKSMNFIDLPAAELWRDELLTRRAVGGDLYFHRPRPPVLQLWQRVGFMAELGTDHVFPAKRIAIATIFDRLDRGICARCTVRVFEECETLAAADPDEALAAFSFPAGGRVDARAAHQASRGHPRRAAQRRRRLRRARRPAGDPDDVPGRSLLQAARRRDLRLRPRDAASMAQITKADWQGMATILPLFSPEPERGAGGRAGAGAAGRFRGRRCRAC